MLRTINIIVFRHLSQMHWIIQLKDNFKYEIAQRLQTIHRNINEFVFILIICF